MRKLLILGGDGQVAQALAALAGSYAWEPVRIGRARLDLATADIEPLLLEHRPDLVVNAAAYTAVDKAETDEAAAYALNALMPGRTARACSAAGVPVVHISTDYVFDGTKPTAYVETDPMAPLGVYGRTKAAGETAVTAAGGAAAVVRTAWVYGPEGANFLRTMLRLANERDEIGVVDDQHGCPTSSRDVALACLTLGERLCAGDPAARGVFHAAGGGETSWASFAEQIFLESARYGGPTARVRPIPTTAYPTPAPRPKNSRLDCHKLFQLTGWRPAPWRETLGTIVGQLHGGGSPAPG